MTASSTAAPEAVNGWTSGPWSCDSVTESEPPEEHAVAMMTKTTPIIPMFLAMINSE
jgi:hypothetical protein